MAFEHRKTSNPPPRRPMGVVRPACLLGAAILLGLFVPIAKGAPLRATRSGPVIGVEADGVVVFKGIPYAAPPVGSLRWRAPEPPADWHKPRDATRFGAVCPQRGTELPQSEDCLTLNLWAPRDGKKHPVAVWVHGGAGVIGSGASSAFDGTRFAREGVVLVTINYRLGRLGFFAHPELDGAGNFAFMDMIAALRWVRDNIAVFGGDPGRVTLMGESSGGMAVTMLMASPEARGLFSAAISQSGGEAQAEAMADAVEAGVRFSKAAGVSSLAALRALPADRLVGTLDNRSPRDGTYTGPMLDGITLVEQPVKVFAADRAAPVPYLTGATSREEAASQWPPGSEQADRMLEGLLARYPAQSASARAVYDIDRIGASEALVRILSDAGYVEPARYYARQHSPSWVYRFSYVATKDRATESGARHAAELRYVFGNPDESASDEDRDATTTVHDAWLRFIRTGNPGWPAFDAAHEVISDFTHHGAVVGPDPIGARLDVVEQAKAR